MKEILKNILINLKFTNVSDVIEIIKEKNYKVISFDIFDTLVNRNVEKPQDVFKILEFEYSYFYGKKLELCKNRINAENIARSKSNKEDISLEDIYAELKFLSEDERKWLKNKEVELEEQLIKKNTDLAIIFQWCKQNNKRIFITSDMYLPKKFIEKLLKNFEYSDYEKLYLSGDVGLTKASGNLFKKILEENNINPAEMLHIGDALKGDFIVPKRLGINTILLKKKRASHYIQLNDKGLNDKESVSYSIITSFIKSNIRNYFDEYSKFGYTVLGPILFGYLKWLNNELKNNDINKIFFLAREGQLLDKGFDILYPNSDIFHKFIYVSRRATAVPRLHKAKNFDDYLHCLTIFRANYRLKNFYEQCLITSSNVDKIQSETQISKERLIDSLSNEEKNILFNTIKPYIDKISHEQEDYIKKYLKTMDFYGKLAVADVGWHGTIQNSLQDIFSEADIYGFYVGKKNQLVNGNLFQIKNTKGYLFENKRDEVRLREVMFTVQLFELLFLSTEPTTVSYGFGNGIAYPNFGKKEQTEKNVVGITNMQNAAITFLNDCKNDEFMMSYDFSAAALYKPYHDLVNPPTNTIINLFREHDCLNMEEDSLIGRHSIIYYIFHPIKLKNDFLNNGCKLLFLKNLFKVPLPYFKFLCFLKKFDNR